MPDAHISQENEIYLTVLETESMDSGRGMARMNPEDMVKLDIKVGDVILITGAGGKEAVAKILPTHLKYRGRSIIQLDGISMENAGACIDDKVTVKKGSYNHARTVT
ncbi:MAG: hypothetical protein PHU31_11260, partial [Anaerotignum sp.]|nr:hypothetical protein [Anaerotignum sp.]